MTEEKPLPAHVQFKTLTSVVAKYIPYHDSKPEPTVVRIAQDRAVDQAGCTPEDLPVPPLPIRHQATESEYIRTGKARFEDMMRILQSENIGLNGRKFSTSDVARDASSDGSLSEQKRARASVSFNIHTDSIVDRVKAYGGGPTGPDVVNSTRSELTLTSSPIISRLTAARSYSQLNIIDLDSGNAHNGYFLSLSLTTQRHVIDNPVAQDTSFGLLERPREDLTVGDEAEIRSRLDPRGATTLLGAATPRQFRIINKSPLDSGLCYS